MSVHALMLAMAITSAPGGQVMVKETIQGSFLVKMISNTRRAERCEEYRPETAHDGDLIFCSTDQNLVRWGIELATWSDITHVAIVFTRWDGRRMVAEADKISGAVQATELAQYLSDSDQAGSVWIRRLQRELTAEERLLLRRFVECHLGEPYARWKELAAVPLRSPIVASVVQATPLNRLNQELSRGEHAWFCTKFVVHACQTFGALTNLRAENTRPATLFDDKVVQIDRLWAKPLRWRDRVEVLHPVAH